MSAPQGYRDPSTAVGHPRNHGHHDPTTDSPASPSTPTRVPRTRVGELWVAAVFGILLVALPGTARIVQLRLLDRRRRRNPEATPAPLDDPAPSHDPDGQLP